MKKILTIMIVLFLTTACTANASIQTNTNKGTGEKTAYNYLDSIDENLIEQAGVDGDFAYDMSDPNKLKENSTNVFVAKVTSIDSATCNLEGYDYSPIPYTLGKLEILKNYLGEAKDAVTFSRVGGTVTMEEYDRNAPSEAVAKREYNRAQQGTKAADYMKVTFNDDIELTAGETYLFYANYNKEYDRYEIIGYEYGSRLLENFDPNAKTIADSVTILNNVTGQKESFSTYVKDYLD